MIEVANSTAFGPSSGVCTQRLDYITRFIELSRYGECLGGSGYRIEMSPLKASKTQVWATKKAFARQ